MNYYYFYKNANILFLFTTLYMSSETNFIARHNQQNNRNIKQNLHA